MPITLRYDCLPSASLELSYTLGIYAYDAYVIDCAQRHGSVILTLDYGLIAAAQRADVKVMEVKQ